MNWSEDAESSFTKLKSELADAALLNYSNPSEGNFHLVTDASKFAVGAALHQCNGTSSIPIAFFSKRLQSAQRSYSAFDRELLAVYLSVLHFKPIVEGRIVVVFTDHKPLVNAFVSPNILKSDRQQRHMAIISEYVHSFEYVRGSDNIVADALSRPDDVSEVVQTIELALPALSDIAISQQQDTEIKNYAERLKPYELPGDLTIFCDKSTVHPRPFVPEDHRSAILSHLHGLSHPGVKGTATLVCERYFWPNMKRDIKEFVLHCFNCQQSKVNLHNKTKVQSFQLPSSDRFHVVHIDIVGPLRPSRTVNSAHPSDLRYLVTMISRATRWFKVVQVASITAETVTEVFVHHWISRFGVPLYLVIDRGQQFESRLLKQLSSAVGFHRLRCSAYHP